MVAALATVPRSVAERRRRVERSVREADIAYVIRRNAAAELSSDDVSFLASVMSDMLGSHDNFGREELAEAIMAKGRSRDVASKLAAAIFK
jgi:hypothetical protein